MNLERKNGKIILGDSTAESLLGRFGSPLYVYSEATIRNQCRTIKTFCESANFRIHYAIKANSSIGLLKIIRSEGLRVEVMSLGEIYIASAAGFSYDKMLFSSNNVSPEIFKTVSGFGIKVVLDSISQISVYGQFVKNGDAYIRLNPNKGDGHHQKVITAGKVKFGIDFDDVNLAFSEAQKYNLTVSGFCIHIGSKFSRYDIFHDCAEQLLNMAKKNPGIRHIDFGGGFGIPYDRKNEAPFPFVEYAPVMGDTLKKWSAGRRDVTFGIQPGRYIVAESGVCLTTVMSDKINKGIRFIGTDLGFNLFLRPVLYNAYHEILNASREHVNTERVTVVGNICESGDILGSDRDLPGNTAVGDVLLVRDTGAYGYSMAGNYNSILRPAEILIDENHKTHIIRNAENYDDLLKRQVK